MSTTRRTAGRAANRSALTWAALATAGAALIARQATRPAPTDTETLDATRTLLRAALPSVRPFDVQLWNGEVIAATRPSRARLILNSPETLGRLLKLPLDMALGEAYLRGDFEIEGNIGDIAAIAETFDATLNPADAPALLRAAATLRRRAGATPPIAVTASLEGPQHSRERDQQAISYHYDVSNDFYRLWLDRRMVYSCAYFPTGTETLDGAQEAKLDLICRKLRLKKGEHLLDIGSGWGGLAIHAAQRYGARVLGVTLSEAQLHEARARAGAAGVADRVTFELRDYRDVLAHAPAGSFDKIASVGMAEHVGRRNMPTYFRAAYTALKPGGLMMNHAISDGIPQARVPLWLQSGNFARKYVFPDGELLPIWETVKHATEAQFEVRDIENLREHYARTLTHWAANLETHHDEARAALGEQRHRLWRLYLGATSHYFEKGHLGLYQTLLAKPDEQRRAHVPLSRADLYEGEMVDG